MRNVHSRHVGRVEGPISRQLKRTPLSTVSPDVRFTAAEQAPVRKQVRGSAVLLAGRGCAIVLNLLVQVILVRSLIKSDFGHLAYALSLVELLSVLAVGCMDKSFARFGAIHHERRELPQFAGVLWLSLITPVVLGGTLAAVILGGGDAVQFLSHDGGTQPLLWAIALLIPFNGVSSVAQSLMTVARGPREVLFRRHLLGPGLKLIAVATVAYFGGQAREMALALLLAGVLGCVADVLLILRVVVEEQLQPYLKLSSIAGVWREVVRTSLALLVTDGAMLARGSLILVLLGWFATSTETAAFRAASSVVKVNELVIINFAVMFIPLASRLFAEGSTAVLWATLRRTNVWITVLSFPVFAFTVGLAAPMTVLLFGPEYGDSARLLVILALGYFVQAVYGFHGQMLRVLNQNRAVINIELLTIACVVPGAVLLILNWGAIGAAIAASAGVMLPSFLKAWVSDRVARNPGADEFRAIRWFTAITAMSLAWIALWQPLDWLTGGLLATATTAAVWFASRGLLNVAETFPELPHLFSRWATRENRAAS